MQRQNTTQQLKERLLMTCEALEPEAISNLDMCFAHFLSSPEADDKELVGKVHCDFSLIREIVCISERIAKSNQNAGYGQN